MKKIFELILVAVFMMIFLSACDTQTTGELSSQQETQSTNDKQQTAENNQPKATEPTANEKDTTSQSTESPKVTKAPAVSDKAASDGTSSSVKGETDNDASIQNDIDGTRELIEDGYYDDAQMMLNNLRTRNLTDSQKAEVEELQKLLDEQK